MKPLEVVTNWRLGLQLISIQASQWTIQLISTHYESLLEKRKNIKTPNDEDCYYADLYRQQQLLFKFLEWSQHSRLCLKQAGAAAERDKAECLYWEGKCVFCHYFHSQNSWKCTLSFPLQYRIEGFPHNLCVKKAGHRNSNAQGSACPRHFAAWGDTQDSSLAQSQILGTLFVPPPHKMPF